MIDSQTKKVGVIGWPISHTLSPVMHNAAFEALGLNYVYLPFAVRQEELKTAVAGLRALNFSGFNVTIPHKISVINYLDEIDGAARLIGAVNTVVMRQGRLIGRNTDAAGFIASLETQGVDPGGMDALILGAGGAARAVVCGLADHGVSKVTVAARQAEKAAAFARDFSKAVNIEAVAFDSPAYTGAIGRANLIVNCTPVGMKPHTDEMPPVAWEAVRQDAVACDLVYSPVKTKFLQQACQFGLKTISGLGMLVEQGAIAFELWTGITAPREVMTGAIYSAF